MENSDLLNDDLQLSPLSQNFLIEAARWGKFLSVVGFIFCGILAFASFFAPAIYNKTAAFRDSDALMSGVMSTVIIIVYLGFAVLLFFPCWFLNKFSVKMKTALNSMSQENFDESFKNLKSLFKFYGIFTIVILSFYILIFAIVILGIAMR
jgi:hypothetical protein